MGVGVVILAAAAAVGAYAFTASNTIADAGNAGIGQQTISGYTVTNVAYTQDHADPSKLVAVDFTLDKLATQVQVKFDDSQNQIASSGWIDCGANNGSTIASSAPYDVHCVLPDVDSALDTLTVAAVK
jgi:3D (Asp-Asp-Asp) domain-containing protein